MVIRKLIGTIAIGSIVYFVRWFFIGQRCHCKRILKEKVIIVTGANSGIGFATAKVLAIKGATVILACRNIKKGHEAKNHLIKISKNRNIFVEELNLASLQSISNFSKNILHKYPLIFALVNNAGIFYHRSEETIDGIEVTFQTNYLGHFLLTILLLPGLRKYPGCSRVVNLSSQAHLNTSLFPQPQFHRQFANSDNNFLTSYEYSKFCLVLFSWKLSQILEKSNISVHCVDPGNTETSIYRYFPQLANRVYFYLQKPIRILIVKTPFEACQNILHAILNKHPPFYINNLQESEKINSRVFNPGFSNILWSISRKLCQKYLIR